MGSRAGPARRAKGTASATLVAAFLLIATVPAAGQGLRAVPMGDWSYRISDALVLRRPDLAHRVWLANRPWREAEIDSLVVAATRSGAASDRGEDLTAGWTRLLAADLGAPAGPASGMDSNRGERPRVAYHNAISVRYAGHLREGDATFDPAFRAPSFDEVVGEPRHRGVARHDFAAQFAERFVLGWRYVVDTNVRNDPTRRTILGIRGTEAAFEVLDAYAAARAGPFRLTVGRQALSWGPGRAASPFVSDSMPAMDQVRAELDADPVHFTAIVAQLSRERPNRLLDESGDTIEGSMPSDGAPVPFDVTRFLYLHRLDWRVFDDLQVAVSEGAIVTGVDRGVEARFVNPLIPFFVSQEEGDEADSENVNVVVDVEGVYTGLGKSRVYADLFVQEFFIDADKRKEIGNQLAWRVGGEWGDPLGCGGGSVGAEYTRVDVFTYLHRGLNTNWDTFDAPIGSTLGPDADQFIVWTDWWFDPAGLATLDFEVRRGGERSLETLESALDAGNPPFPSGVVQREWRVGAELWGLRLEWGLEGRLRVARRSVENIANEEGRDGDFWEANLDFTYWLPIP